MAYFYRILLYSDPFYPGNVHWQYQHYFADVVLPLYPEFSLRKRPARRHSAWYRDSGKTLPAYPSASAASAKEMERDGLVGTDDCLWIDNSIHFSGAGNKHQHV